MGSKIGSKIDVSMIDEGTTGLKSNDAIGLKSDVSMIDDDTTGLEINDAIGSEIDDATGSKSDVGKSDEGTGSGMGSESDDDTTESMSEDDASGSEGGTEYDSPPEDMEYDIWVRKVMSESEPDHEAIARKLLYEKIGKFELPLPLLPLEYSGDLQSLLREAAGCGELKTDVDEITIAVVEGKAELVVMAMDAQDFDSLEHLPILSLTRKVDYFLVPYTEHLSAAPGESESVCCVMKGSSSLVSLIQNLILRTTLTVQSGDESAIEPPPLKKSKLNSPDETVGETPDPAGNSDFQSMAGEKKRREENVKALHDKIKAKFHVPVVVGIDDASRNALNMVRDATFYRTVKKGINEVTKAVCTGSAEFVVMAADAEYLDRMLHLPILAKSKNVSYIFIPYSEDLTEECGLDPESQLVNACCATLENVSSLDIFKKTVNGILNLQLVNSQKADSGIEPPLMISPFATPQITGCPWCLNTFASDEVLGLHMSVCQRRSRSAGLCFARDA